jgi:hypothetical protein
MTYSTVSSHFLHIQRTALMYNGGMLIGMCIELVVRVHTACHVSCIALVILDKLLERELLTGISLDALHDALAADGAIVGNGLPAAPCFGTKVRSMLTLTIRTSKG